MVLADSSAWVEFLRDSGSRVHLALRRLVERTAVATTEVVVMEVLAGARDPAHLQSLRRLMLGCHLVPVEGLVDYEGASAIYRRCRSRGETVRALTDCLVAVVAIRADLAVLHADSDYDTIARHTDLRIADVA